MAGSGADPGPVDYIARTRETYARLGYQAYSWVVSEDDPPLARLPKQLSECRLGLASSGGVYRVGQIAFHYKDDTTLRAIDSSVSLSDLRATHFAYDTTDARRDPNCVIPLGALRALVDEGKVGRLAPTVFGFMGGIYSKRRVRTELADRLAQRMRAEEVDAVLLVPV